MPLRTRLAGPVEEAALGLLGCKLAHGAVVLRITEVEAYGGPEDSASHARHGCTPRNAPMWGPPGRAYLYLCYGVHWMLNVVTGPEESAAAVLIRGAEVLAGGEVVCARRGVPRLTPEVCAGPGKVAQALGLDGSHGGVDLLGRRGLRLRLGVPPVAVVRGPRVGIDFAGPEDRLRAWRFAESGHPAVSRPHPKEVAPW